MRKEVGGEGEWDPDWERSKEVESGTEKMMEKLVGLAGRVRQLKPMIERTVVSQEFSAAAAAGVGTARSYSLPDLPYDYAALEPVISAKIMEVHHSKHHNAYVTNLNKALDALDKAKDVNEVIALGPALKFHGGGHLNHSIFWTNLCPPDTSQPPSPDSALGKLIAERFGSMDAFVTQFNAKSAAIQGSGWGWLGYDKARKSVEFVALSNQDPLEASTGLTPLLGVDCWEHAYHMQYFSDRPGYLKSIWRCINWQNVEHRLQAAMA
ncbi:Superoxide dismutase Mn, mitochondrial [Porphyridium purpureum]|uniref:superoxide dismutase n=1 Tax=Porphyridium purpureum TaxID=35688 RepID=A0A5J4YVZ4_PORPP|nr:Superoxide dismutase Mn, mitochondrial [Porphyridium purpureum]|eukprot:POR6556..scf227_4